MLLPASCDSIMSRAVEIPQRHKILLAKVEPDTIEKSFYILDLKGKKQFIKKIVIWYRNWTEESISNIQTTRILHKCYTDVD